MTWYVPSGMWIRCGRDIVRLLARCIDVARRALIDGAENICGSFSARTVLRQRQAKSSDPATAHITKIYENVGAGQERCVASDLAESNHCSIHKSEVVAKLAAWASWTSLEPGVDAPKRVPAYIWRQQHPRYCRLRHRVSFFSHVFFRARQHVYRAYQVDCL
jgi:hypothetical protein